MPKFKITIEETLVKDLYIEAEDRREARLMAIDNYNKAADGYVLGPDCIAYAELFLDDKTIKIY